MLGPQPPERSYLFGEKFFAQLVKGDELPGQQSGFSESFCYQHNLTDQLEVGNYHCARPEAERQRLGNSLEGEIAGQGMLAAITQRAAFQAKSSQKDCCNHFISHFQI